MTDEARKRVEQQLDQYGSMVMQQLVAKKWEELVVEEQEVANFLLFKDALRSRKRDGTWEVKPVNYHPLRNHEKRAARKTARDLASKSGIDPDKDPDVFSDLDNVCILQLALRNITAPFEPLCSTPEELERMFDRETLAQAFGILNDYSSLLDPQLEHMNREQFMVSVAAVAEGRSIRPLRAFGGECQTNFVITMATLLNDLLTSKSLSESSEQLMPEPSPSNSSSSGARAPT